MVPFFVTFFLHITEWQQIVSAVERKRFLQQVEPNPAVSIFAKSRGGLFQGLTLPPNQERRDPDDGMEYFHWMMLVVMMTK